MAARQSDNLLEQFIRDLQKQVNDNYGATRDEISGIRAEISDTKEALLEKLNTIELKLTSKISEHEAQFNFLKTGFAGCGIVLLVQPLAQYLWSFFPHK